MSDRLTEIVIEYHPADLEAWKRGEKEKWLKDRTVPSEVYSQSEYHFGEYFVLTYFEKALWKGYCWYALGNYEPDNPKLLEGREKVRELIPADKLAAFQAARLSSKYSEGKGEPDLFLYMDGGPQLFLEVKKEGDRVHPAQLECLAQIQRLIHARVGIVYLAKHGHTHKPRSYDLDLGRSADPVNVA